MNSPSSRSETPDRLIDPDGEGVYVRANSFKFENSLLVLAGELLGDWREWRNLIIEPVWMREDDDGYWHRADWRWWYGLRWRLPVTLYHYITPKPEAM